MFPECRIQIHYKKEKGNILSIKLFGLCFSTIMLLLTACAGSKVETTAGTIQGKIYVTGNEPFTRLALEDAKGKVYFLSCSKELKEKLLKQQGLTVRLHCSQIIKGENQNSATVERFERLKMKSESRPIN